MQKERIELCCHTNMDLKGGILGVEELVYMMEKTGVQGIGITDFAGILSYPSICRKKFAEDKIILGMEANVVFENQCKHPVTVLVKNKVGLRNLTRMVTESELNQTGAFPEIKEETLWDEQNREGLLFGASDELAKEVVFGSDYEKKIEIVSKYDFVIIDVNRSAETNLEMVQLAEAANIPAIATSQVYYKTPDEKLTYDILMYGKYEQLPVEEKRHFMSTEEMLDALGYLGERTEVVVIDNTHIVADMCERINIFPKAPTYPKIKDGDKKLRQICEKALTKKYTGSKLLEAKNRLKWELMSIEYTESHFIFLMLREYLKKLKVKPWEKNTRRDAASSIVSYLCGITDTDPIEYNLTPYFAFGLDGKKTIRFELNLLKSKFTDWSEMFEACSIPVTRIFTTKYDVYSSQEISIFCNKYISEVLNGNEESVDQNCVLHALVQLGNVLSEKKVDKNSFYLIPEGYDYSGIFPETMWEDGTPITYYDYKACDQFFYRQTISETEILDLLHIMTSQTKSDLSKVSFEDTRVLEVLQSKSDFNFETNAKEGVFDFYPYKLDMEQVLCPQSFKDCVKLMGMLHGTSVYYANISSVLVHGNNYFEEMIATKEDIYDFMRERGCGKELSYNMAVDVAKGGAALEDSLYDDFLEFCRSKFILKSFVQRLQRVEYLFSRAQCVDYMRITWYLAWFKVNYPSVYYKAVEEFEDEFSDEEIDA